LPLRDPREDEEEPESEFSLSLLLPLVLLSDVEELADLLSAVGMEGCKKINGPVEGGESMVRAEMFKSLEGARPTTTGIGSVRRRC